MTNTRIASCAAIADRSDSFSSKEKKIQTTNADETKRFGALAPWRETSGSKRVEEFFTQSREGAKRGNESKHRGFLGHAIGNALNAVLDQVVAEIYEEAKSFVHQPQISQHLFTMDWIERGDRFHFHDHAIVDDQVGTKPFVEPDPIPYDRNRHLSFHRVAAFAQFMRERDFVNDFEDAWTEPGVQAVGSVDDHSRDFILFHAAKPELLLRSCEAKNLRALASLREISGWKQMNAFFTQRIKEEKTKHLVQSLT